MNRRELLVAFLTIAAFATPALRSPPAVQPTDVGTAIRAPSRVSGDQAAATNDNRTPAGTRVGDTLLLRLTIMPVVWQILGDSNPGFRVFAFAEEGKTPTVPGPLLRVRVGTPIHVVIQNPLGDTLVLRGLGESVMRDSLVVLPSSTAEVTFVARRAGTYHYWGALAGPQRAVVPGFRQKGLLRPRSDSQLAGAFIVDPPGPVANDRIFVITETTDQLPPPLRRDRYGIPGREFTALNGRSWPYTERLGYTEGDTVRWRIINTSFQAHPMHLHGFYFRVDSHGSALADVDSIYAPADRRMAVTEVIGRGETVSIVWSPDRVGGWIFHCHLTSHVAMLPRADQPDAIEYLGAHDHGDPDNHVVNGMNGLILGITVVGRARPRVAWHPAKRLRLFVQSDSTASDSVRRFGYVLQRGAEPRRDSVERSSPVLVLTRGEPTSIEVVNRSTEPTAVHWHGIELESYYDGAVGWGGTVGRNAPAVRPDSSFEVRITPRRAGTFMYHTHFNELRQQYGGLVGALVVLEPGERWDPTRDLLFVVSQANDGRVLVNGSLAPPPRELQVGTTYRIRIADIAGFGENLWARVVRDSSLLSWRAVSKDGFTLPIRQATTRPSIARVSSGETADFEFIPETRGELRLEVVSVSPITGVSVRAAVQLRIVAP